MNPQDLIRSIMTALDNIGSDEQTQMGEPSMEPKQDGGIEKVQVPTMAVLTPVKVDNSASSDGTAVKGMFPAPEHAKSEEPMSGDCGCGGEEPEANNEPDELEIMKRSAGISRPPQE
jgi:hypothetical protein